MLLLALIRFKGAFANPEAATVTYVARQIGTRVNRSIFELKSAA